MAANTILTSVVTGGANSHATTAEEANSLATDFVTQGVVGAITLNSGSGGTGSFCVNADTSPDMGITIKSGQAYVTATPSGQNSQVLRARASSDYTAYTINANSSGSTKYDWIYLKVDPTNANVPSSDASNVASIFTSRSSSNTTDNGSPPTYGLLLAVVTVANAASSITNSNITDKRFNSSIGAQNGSLIVTQSGTGVNAKVQAAGIDTNVNLELDTKGTGTLVATTASLAGLGGAWTTWTPTWTNLTVGNGTVTANYIQIGKTVFAYIRFVLGTTSSISGNPTFTAPIAAASRYGASEANITGSGYAADFGVAAYNCAVGFDSSTTALKIYTMGVGGTYGNLVGISSTIPFTWGSTDLFNCTFTYEAA